MLTSWLVGAFDSSFHFFSIFEAYLFCQARTTKERGLKTLIVFLYLAIFAEVLLNLYLLNFRFKIDSVKYL